MHGNDAGANQLAKQELLDRPLGNRLHNVKISYRRVRPLRPVPRATALGLSLYHWGGRTAIAEDTRDSSALKTWSYLQGDVRRFHLQDCQSR